MRLRSGDRFFDFDGDIEIERQWKLFEKIDETVGDFSYQFEMPRTDNNMSILGFPTPDAVKSIYKSVPCDILDEDGIPFYTGQIRVEGRPKDKISCSYFSGNFNWISELNGLLTDLDFTQFDSVMSTANIRNSWQHDEEIIYPLLDVGLLASRRRPHLIRDDFTGCIFVKNIFQRITWKTGIKFNGDLFKDPAFNSMIISRNTRSDKDIDARSSFANKTSDQTFTATTSGVGVTVSFQDDSTLPYYDGSLNNYSTSTYKYIADVSMRVLIEVDLGSMSASTIAGGLNVSVRVNINGTLFELFDPWEDLTTTSFEIPKLSMNRFLEAGDEVYVDIFASTGSGTSDVTIKEDSTFKVTPLNILYTSGENLVPDWTQAQFVNNIISLFCGVSDYDTGTKTVTINMIKDILSKEPIDLSEYLTVDDIDFKDVVSGLSKQNTLSYRESDNEDIEGYSQASFIRYGKNQLLRNGVGIINIDNDFIADEGVIIESDFTAPSTYINPIFKCSMERVKYFIPKDIVTGSFPEVKADPGGGAVFGITDLSVSLNFQEGDLVRISDASNDIYNGEWIIEEVGSGSPFISRAWIILSGCTFSADSTGKVTKVIHSPSNNDDVHVFWQTEYDSNQVPEYSGRTQFQLNTSDETDVAYPYFNLLNSGFDINNQYKESMSFGPVDSPFHYQRNITDRYWSLVSRVLNDPTKIFTKGLLPKIVFMSLTPLRPIRLRTKETDGLYYLNRITGYKNSYKECDVELIKLP